ncbi:MAG: FkbM family methyltransferase [Anaerolineae bacterium]|nr:FkbM family methyltransferase [Anaerolineae bacterium]
MKDRNGALPEAWARSLEAASGSIARQIARNPRKLSAIFGKYLNALARRKNVLVETETFWGEKMNVLLPTAAWSLLAYGFFEAGLTTMALEHVGQGQVFYDIGAHFGYYTLLAHRLVGPGGQVHAFEPTPSTHAILQSNAAGRDNVFLNGCAAFCECTVLPFHDYGPTYSAYNSFRKARLGGLVRAPEPTTIDVQTTTVDEYVKSTQAKPDFVKIDAESTEMEVLKGMEETLAERKPIVSLEVGDMDVPGAPRSRDTISHLLERGYCAYEYRGGRIVPHQLRDRYAYADILFLPDKAHRV